MNKDEGKGGYFGPLFLRCMYFFNSESITVPNDFSDHFDLF